MAVRRITPEGIRTLKGYSTEERTYACKQHFGYFLVYYQQHYITHRFDDYHYDMMQDVHDLLDGKITELAWIMYRGSTKTALEKALILYCICYDIDPYITVGSFDDTNSEGILFDVIIELQTNMRIKEDFGELYNTVRSKDEITKKRIKDFMTNQPKDEKGNIIGPGTRVEAHTTQESMRGRTTGAYRPGLAILDDFETLVTVKSKAKTKAIRAHIAELKGGRDLKRGRILYSGNYLSEYGNIQMLIDRAKMDPKLRVRIVPIHNGVKPLWPSRFVMTDAEAQKTGKISIESVKRSMWTPDEGDSSFHKEMLCEPTSDVNAIFKKAYFKPISQEEVRAKGLSYLYVTLDTPSIKEGAVTYNDYAGFTMNYVTADGHFHFKAWSEHLGPTALVKKICDLYSEVLLDPTTVWTLFAWEDTAYTRGLELALRTEMGLRGIDFSIHFLTPAGRNKEDRIRSGLLYRYETGKIHHIYVDGEPTCTDLEYELLRFPESENDDCSDSAAYQSDVARAPGERATSSPHQPKMQIVKKVDDPYQRTQQKSVYEQDDDDDLFDEDDNIHNPFASIEG